MAKDETIKAGAEKETVKNPTPPPTVKEEKETVNVDKATLKELIQTVKDQAKSIEDLQKNAVAQNPNQGMEISSAPKFKEPKTRKWQDKYFIGYENIGKPNNPKYVYDIYNPQTREMEQFCNVILDGEEKPIKLNYVDFVRESERVKVKIKKTIELPDLVITQGYVQKKDFADNGYGMFETMVSVPLNVITKQYNYLIEVEDGRELEVTEEAFK